MGLLTPSIPNIAIAICSFLLSVAALYIYRAFFDSLSHIPGPKLAAASLWYEFYYDVIKRGRYTWEIGRMHEKYGNHPITLPMLQVERALLIHPRPNRANQSIRSPHP